jgi:hypothetical protein
MGLFGGAGAASTFQGEQLLWCLLLGGLLLLTLLLLLAMRTRWGQSKPLRKCVLLSIMAHLLLAGYATTVQIVESSHVAPEDSVLRVTTIDTGEQPSGPREKQPPEIPPWEVLPAETPELPKPEDVPPPVRPELAELEPAEAVRDPWTPPSVSEALDVADVPTQQDPLPQPGPIASRQSPSTSSSPQAATQIEAPAPRQQEALETARPVTSDVQRAESSPASDVPQPERPHPGDLPEQLRTPPRPRAQLTELPLDPQQGRPPATVSDASAASSSTVPDGNSQDDQATDVATSAASTEEDPLDAPWQESSPGEAADTTAEIASESVSDSNSVEEGLEPIAGSQQPRPRNAEVEPPRIFRNRLAGDRQQILERYGGSRETEEAVEAALVWLAGNQSPDGRWDVSHLQGGMERHVGGRDRQAAGAEADSGVSGLALLAFLGAGHTHATENQHQKTVQAGLDYLLRIQAPDGNLGGKAVHYAFMYCHGMATLALGEAYAMTHDARLAQPLRRAVDYTLAAQHPTNGGWRYRPGDLGDTSQLGWQLMALRSAEHAGIPIPARTRRGMQRYLQSVSAGHYGGLASYRPGERISATMTAEALVCRQFLGMAQDHRTSSEAGNYLLQELPGHGQQNLYYWYYGTLGMYQVQGEFWRRWNDALRRALLATQRTTGSPAGSWDPTGTWGGYGGRAYSTAMGALCLEVYYRYLPMYEQLPPVADRRK